MADFVSHPPPLHLRAALVASKPTSIKGFAGFYQIGSTPENGNPGLMCSWPRSDRRATSSSRTGVKLWMMTEADCPAGSPAGLYVSQRVSFETLPKGP
jgi:hypothetical protein